LRNLGGRAKKITTVDYAGKVRVSLVTAAFDHLEIAGSLCFKNFGYALPFLNTYRTMCVAPEAEFRQLLQDIRTLDFAA